MSESPSGPGRHELAIRLHLDRVHVSYVSALLRVVQAALREVAQSDDEARQRFDRRPQPVLLLTSVATDGGLTLGFAFADPLDSRPLEDLSARTFSGFLEAVQRVREEPAAAEPLGRRGKAALGAPARVRSGHAHGPGLRRVAAVSKGDSEFRGPHHRDRGRPHGDRVMPLPAVQ